MSHDHLQHRFVEFIPERLDDGILYVSMEYRTVSHLCCCGCRSEVVTPLGPTDWRLIFDGKCVSLEPSIGSWSLPCRSHYWIRRNRVVWAPCWSEEEILVGREQSLRVRADYYQNQAKAMDKSDRVVIGTDRVSDGRDIWARIRSLFHWK